MPKSKDAFRTISEVAEWLETPAHVLRFWESKFTQVKPVKRAGGRRYYRPADMRLLGGIKKLLHDDGLTIKGAQKLLREHGVKHVADLSQPLDEDLIEESQIAEAAYEPDAQPEPAIEEPAKVLSFPSRSEHNQEPTPAPDSVAAKPVQEAAPTTPSEPKQEESIQNEAAQDVAVADDPSTTTAPDAVQAPEEEPAPLDRSGDSPAFGSDALPAFLRRSPNPPTASETEPAQEVASAESDTPNSAPTLKPEKLTINPTAHFKPVEPVNTDSTQEGAPRPEPEIARATPVAPAAPTEPQPMFAHRKENTEPQGEIETSAATTQMSDATEKSVELTPKPIVDATPETAPARVHIDLPAIAKIAPELDSYSAPAGVLAALPSARKIAPEIANQLLQQLVELRALRDRMQSH
ncbi:MerR family transcriptional regulator [Planktotalea sp.]|uniref:MerR family transcriptional regulator n=1 Tax=Planktotalea sp. TaxID=2029877 RepID=UPI0025D93B21|nr:MerR family transcriptional regulator [Planktotalea sp.]